MYQKQLKDLKKANKERKLKLAVVNGFSTVESYLDFLVNELKKGVPEPVTQPTAEPITINKVVLLDCSGSMDGAKIENAINGINKEIEALKKETEVDYLYTLITFSSNIININYLKTPIKDVKNVYFTATGGTNLYDAIGKSYEIFGKETDKTLINIFTDGEENHSCRYNRSQIQNLISTHNHITTTFVGTKFDVALVQRDLGIDASNTLSYDGTGQGLKISIETTITATKSFANDVSRGVDVKKGFYKKIVK